jgi:ABC-2 type transport system ATP-binding protein
MPTVLEARELVKQYPGVLAVDHVSFSVEEGTCFGLLGPNGAGKTTTVEIIEGIIPPDSGQILYCGEPTGRRFREEAGIQFQNTALQDFLTVRETIQLFQSLYDRKADIRRVIEECSLGTTASFPAVSASVFCWPWRSSTARAWYSSTNRQPGSIPRREETSGTW